MSGSLSVSNMANEDSTGEEKSSDDSIENAVAAATTDSPPLRFWSVLYSTITSCLLTLLVGATLAFSSPVLLELTQLSDPDFRFNTRLSNLFGAISQVGAVFGGPLAGLAADRWGRKVALAINSLPYTFGYLIILSSYLATDGLVFKLVLMFGRFITGIGMGWSYFAVPVYIGEIAPARYRGILGVFPELFLTLGVMLVFGLSSIPGLRYFDLALVMIALMAIFGLMVVWIPETPRWLLSRPKAKRHALAVLKYLRRPTYSSINEELREIESSLNVKKSSFSRTLKMIFTERSILIPFLVVLFLYVFQQLCMGGSTVPAYGALIFLEAGVSNPELTSAYSIGVSAVLSTLIAAFLVEFLGRKLLLVVSAAGMSLSSGMLGIHFYLTRPPLCFSDSNSSSFFVNTTPTTSLWDQQVTTAAVSCNPHLYPLAIVSVVLFIVSFSLGLGPVPWVLLSEYLPLQVRGMAGGIVVASNWITGSVVTGSFLSYSQLVGNWFSWWSVFLINLIGCVIIVLVVVETKGKELEEVEDLFKSRGACYSCSSLTCTKKESHNEPD